ncbi:hypothetical protein AB4865_02000 [Capnocytophaga sp. ARDL2]|uniref:hypothetical protein n=1 Tax=Capnocytophaga sp. ARDL2 TaxID=3238809 RepID=UPI0035580DCE
MQTNFKNLPRGAKSEIAKRTELSVMTIIAYFKGKKIHPKNESKILEALEQILTEQRERTNQAKERIQALLQ